MVGGESSSYYPGCKKSADCLCETCLASISATLDLMPASIQRSSITKISSSHTKVDRVPLAVSPSAATTPKSNAHDATKSPDLRSTARNGPRNRPPLKNDERISMMNNHSLRSGLRKLIVGLGLLLAVGAGTSYGMHLVITSTFSSDAIKGVAQRATDLRNLSSKIRFLEAGLKNLVFSPEKILNCSSPGTNWKISQEGVLIRFRCVIYKSRTEEVSIWGWPLQSAGLLRAGHDSRFFTVLSGRITEWSDGSIGYSVHMPNASWSVKRYEASAVQLDNGTWIVEYKRSCALEMSRMMLHSLVEMAHYKICRAGRDMNVKQLVRSFPEDLSQIPT